jgi:hypothetical protein
MSLSDMGLVDAIDDLAQIRRRVGALRLCAVAIELESGSKRDGQAIREIVEIIDADLAEVVSQFNAANAE